MVARARACVGARFRLQGRDPASGLDCVGVAARAFAVDPPPARYGLRGGAAAALMEAIGATGVRRVPRDEAAAGDLMLVEAGPHQFHLLVLTDTGFVHADARLRRVVEARGRPDWPVLAVWRKD